jgi:hypothetical protein
VQEVEALRDALRKTQRGVRIVVAQERLEGRGDTMEGVARSLRSNLVRGDGEVAISVRLTNGARIDLRLPGRFDTSPVALTALETVAGIEEMFPF